MHHAEDTRREWIADLVLPICRTYNSGYPGVSGLGSPSLGLPFSFWPVAFGVGAIGAVSLHDGNVRILLDLLRPPHVVDSIFSAMRS